MGTGLCVPEASPGCEPSSVWMLLPPRLRVRRPHHTRTAAGLHSPGAVSPHRLCCYCPQHSGALQQGRLPGPWTPQGSVQSARPRRIMGDRQVLGGERVPTGRPPRKAPSCGTQTHPAPAVLSPTGLAPLRGSERGAPSPTVPPCSCCLSLQPE